MNSPGLFGDVDEFETSTIVGDHILHYLPNVPLFKYEGVNVYQKQLDGIQS